MKLQSAAQQKQLEYLRPYLCRWAGPSSTNTSGTSTEKREAGRHRAAPHIKTYIQFSDAEKMDSIDWAMVSSANLSTQAWGAAVNTSGKVRICSWEMGVLVWPGLFVQPESGGTQDQDQGQQREAVMVPCFQTDVPDAAREAENGEVKVGFRMPYDLPLTPYTAGDMPWCATASYSEPDWLGQTWEG